MNDQIADIATRNGLGRPEGAFGPADGDGPRERELHLFEHGVVVRLAGDTVQGLRWDAVTVLKDVVDPFRSVYSLTDGAEPPVVIDGFARPEEWGPAIHQAVLRTHLPQARAALQAGRTIHFGELAATGQALLTPTGPIPWTQISEAGVENGIAAVKVGQQWRTLANTHARDIPNFLVLYALIEELKVGVRAASGSQRGWVIGGVASVLVTVLIAVGVVGIKRLVRTGVSQGLTAAEETSTPTDSPTDTYSPPTETPTETYSETPEPTPTEEEFDPASLDETDTDETPITIDALIANSFTTRKGVRYTLKGTRSDKCPAWFQEGGVASALRKARCKKMLSGIYASSNSTKNNRIMVVVRVIPLKDADTAETAFKRLEAGSRDWGFMCPLKGPGSQLCANGRGSWSSAYIWGWTRQTHRYIISTLALYENLADSSSTKKWLTDASKAALDAGGPMVYNSTD